MDLRQNRDKTRRLSDEPHSACTAVAATNSLGGKHMHFGRLVFFASEPFPSARSRRTQKHYFTAGRYFTCDSSIIMGSRQRIA